MAAKAPPKTRSEKLRSSCDSCYNSKIKCSRSQPLCSRCLVCGTNCIYSPSGRSGRKSKKVEENIVLDNAVPAQDGDEILQFDIDTASFQPNSAYDAQMSVHATSLLQPSLDSYLEHSQFEYIDPVLFMSSQACWPSLIPSDGVLSFDPSSWMMDINTLDYSLSDHTSDTFLYSYPTPRDIAGSTLSEVFYSPRMGFLAPGSGARQSASDQQSAVWQYTST